MSAQNRKSARAAAAGERKWLLSANLLLEGDVVYRTAAGGWSRAIAKAAVAQSEEAAAALLAAAKAEPHLVVDAALAEATVGPEGRVAPVSHRERIRALGPTHRPDLGKQAERAAAQPDAEAA